MNQLEILFLLTSFVSIFLFFITGKLSNWSNRSVTDPATAYWNASLSIIWGIAALKLRNGSPVSLSMIIPIIPTTLIYGALSQIQDMQFDLTGKGIDKTSIAVLAVLGVIVLFFVGSLIYVQRSKSSFSILGYFLPVLAFLVWCLTWLGFRSTYSVEWKFMEQYQTFIGTYSWHLHHWMIALIGFFLARYPSVWSDIVAGIFWGVFCEELAAFGIDIPVDFHTNQGSPVQPYISRGAPPSAG